MPPCELEAPLCAPGDPGGDPGTEDGVLFGLLKLPDVADRAEPPGRGGPAAPRAGAVPALRPPVLLPRPGGEFIGSAELWALQGWEAGKAATSET